MRKGILLLFLGLFVSIGVQAQEVKNITLQEAIEIALENSSDLKQAQNNLGLAEKQVLGAKADFLPSLGGQISGQTTKGQQFNNTTLELENTVRHSMSASLGSDIAIFQGFTNIINLRRSNINEDYQQANKSRTRQTVIFNATSGFLQVVLNQQLLKIAQENLASAQEQLKQVEAQVEVGSRPTVDLYNQQSTVASNELTVTQRENDLSYSKTQLIGTLQLDPAKEYSFEAPSLDELKPVPENLSLSELIDQALANRNDLQAQKYLIMRNEKDLSLSRAKYYPSVIGNFGIRSNYFDTYRIRSQSGITTVSFNDQFFNQNVNKYIGLSINVPIFNNLSTRLSVQSSKVNYKNSRLQYENLKYSVLQEVRQAYNDYQSYATQLNSTAKALQAAERSYTTQKERYEVGAGTLVELSDANAQYVQAQANRAQAILQFMFQKKLLNYYLGRLNEDISLNS